MLVIPLTGKLNKNNLPYATIFLILINCIVFFFFQADDRTELNAAYNFYEESGLAEIELTRYQAYEGNTLPYHAPASDDEEAKIAWHQALTKMARDDAFQRELAGDRIITPVDPLYPNWKKLRTEFEGLLQNTFSYRFGLIPSQQKALNLLTHMFAHSGLMHLLGNMVFLWLVGCSLELGCGSLFYLLLYLVGGVAACEAFALTQPASTLPLLGASGAISALMGAFTVIYGKKRIKVLYSLIFYFNYAEVPALLLLPVWVGFEAVKLLTGSSGNIAYVAHIGGLAAGAMIGWLYLKVIGKVNETVFQEDPKDRIPLLMDRALRHVENLEMKEARDLLETVLAIDPENRKAMMHLFHIEKLRPADPRFHQTAAAFLLQLSKEMDPGEVFLRFWEDYEKAPVSEAFPAETIQTICMNLMNRGQLKAADQVLVYLFKNHPRLKSLPGTILALSLAWDRRQDFQKGQHYLKLLRDRYPQLPWKAGAWNLSTNASILLDRRQVLAHHVGVFVKGVAIQEALEPSDRFIRRAQALMLQPGGKEKGIGNHRILGIFTDKDLISL